MIVSTKWVKGLSFESTANEHSVKIDTTVNGGGNNSGMSPKQMLLGALAGCSGMDVVGILDKMKATYSTLEIIAEAEQTDTHPKVFKFINLIYKSDILEDDLDKLQKAITLSKEKYCGVSAMLAKHCEINFIIEKI